jgi:PTS system mannose-specific IIA component
MLFFGSIERIIQTQHDSTMSNSILLIAHAPLAHALRQCALHVYPECAAEVMAIDVAPNASPEETLASARLALQQTASTGTLVLTDVFGATPANVAQKLVDGVTAKLVAGVNLPMLLRTVCYRHESLDALVTRALAGGAQGVMQVAITAPQNQARRQNDPNTHHHQQ